jgi:plastocyanin
MGIRRRTVVATLLAAVAGLSWPTLGSPAAGAETQQATCAANGTALTIGADDKKFDKDCLAVPPEQAFTIEFDNRDLARGHNVAIYDTAGGNNEQLFKGEVIRGPAKTTYSVPAQAKGVYEFVCDPHADEMRGTFIVG